MEQLPYAETINYWKTGQSAPDTWIDKAKREIGRAGGRILAEGFGSEEQTGRSAFMLAFELDGERFKAVWPVLPTKGKNNARAAKIQAATLLYHDVKARAISSRVLGARAAFFCYLLLPDGRTAATLASPELMRAIPPLLQEG